MKYTHLLASGSEDETIKLWDVEAALAGGDDVCIARLRVDRLCERTDITGITEGAEEIAARIGRPRRIDLRDARTCR